MKRTTLQIAATLAFALLVASCGGGEPAADSGVDLERIQETANEALAEAEAAAKTAETAEAKAEAAKEAVKELEEELAAGGSEHAVSEHADSDSHSEEDSHESDHGEAPHWGYEGEIGPEHWASLDEAFYACEAGMEQSPIDIVAADAFPVGLDDLDLKWQTSDLTVINNGHTIQANVAEGNSTVIGGHEYNLLQFHFHKPSEHEVESELFPMELHFVHADADGNLAVVGVLLAAGETNPLYDILWAAQPEEGVEVAVDGFDITSLLPHDLTRYHYSGSLTTPPCSEGVNWNVIVEPSTMSEAQIEEFLYEGNNRPVLPVNDRQILIDAS